jgi:hypothetical protein
VSLRSRRGIFLTAGIAFGLYEEANDEDERER